MKALDMFIFLIRKKEFEDRETRCRLLEKTTQKLEMIKRNVKNGKTKKGASNRKANFIDG